MVEDLTDAEAARAAPRRPRSREGLRRVSRAPSTHVGAPTVILAKTIKGYGLGEAGEGRNVTHQQKKMNEKELREFRDRFGIPIADRDLLETPFYRPPDDSEEIAVPARAARAARRFRADASRPRRRRSRRCRRTGSPSSSPAAASARSRRRMALVRHAAAR